MVLVTRGPTVDILIDGDRNDSLCFDVVLTTVAAADAAAAAATAAATAGARRRFP